MSEFDLTSQEIHIREMKEAMLAKARATGFFVMADIFDERLVP